MRHHDISPYRPNIVEHAPERYWRFIIMRTGIDRVKRQRALEENLTAAHVRWDELGSADG